MTAGIISIKKDASVEDAMKAMIERRVTSLIIDKEGENDHYGILTRKDIVNKVVANNRDPKKVKVSEIMSEPLLCISQDFTAENIARLMQKTGVRRFPVIEDGQIVGMVSNSDIMRAITLECI